MNMKGSHRGVETIISAMLQIVIMVAAFSLAYGAYFSWVSTQRRGSTMQMQERMVVEAVWFQSSTTASIYVSNVGKSDVNIDEVRVNGVSCTISTTSLSIVPTHGGWITVTYTGGFVSEITYTFTIITERGTSLETLANR